MTNRLAQTSAILPWEELALPTGGLQQPYPQPPAGLPVEYPVRAWFAVNGGQFPYAWSLAPGSPGLPPGLFLVPDPSDSSRCVLAARPLGGEVFLGCDRRMRVRVLWTGLFDYIEP
jgi:hypothetical protein